MIISPFQTECEKRLLAALQPVGRTLGKRELAGETETYITGCVSESPFRVWIYADGEANLMGPGVDLRFESPDYGSEDELISAFVDAVRRMIMREPQNMHNAEI